MNSKGIHRIAVIGVMSALAVAMAALINFPIFPMVPFLRYDPADIPIIIVTFFFGPLYGIVMTAIVSIVQGLTVCAGDGWIGILMHFFATGALAAAVGLVKNGKQSLKRDIIAAASGIAAMTLTMALWNLLFTPIYMHMTISELMPFYPFIILFNLIKAGVNTSAAVVIYKALNRIFNKN